MDKELLAKNLRRFRDKAGLSLLKLAGISHVAKNTISQIEAGRGNPTVDTIETLAGALQCSFHDLLGTPPLTAHEEFEAAAREVEGVPPGAAYDMLAAQRAMKEALGMLEHFANLKPAQQKIVLAMIYNDPGYLAGIRPDDVPKWFFHLVKLPLK